MFVKPVRFFCIAILIVLVVFPAMPAAASAATQDNIVSDGQFVYGPNVGSFDIKTYLNTNAAHLAKYADDLYGRAEYYSINPKIYLTLLELHSHLLSVENSPAMDNPFGLGNDGFIAQIDAVSEKMTAAYYAHLYNYSALPTTERNMQPFTTPSGSTIEVASDTNAGTYALIAGLAAIDEPNLTTVLDNKQPNGFYQTYQRLFENDNPLDENNHINIPGSVSTFGAPDSLSLQLPYLRGLSWRFGGVHDTGGCSGLGSNQCQFTDASAIDMYPAGATWGMDTSSMWIVAAAAGIPTRVSNCYFKVLYSDGWETDYYHLENTQFLSGTVQQNDKIGIIANTLAEATCNGGAASGPHVHFWLRHNGVNVAINGTALAGWYIHAGRWSYDTDPNYMWIEKAGLKKYAFSDTILSEAPGLTFATTSLGAQDGWLLESGEKSNSGGKKNATDGTFRLGDDATKKQYLGILSFDTSGLPDTAVITSVTLKVKKQAIVGGGNPLKTFHGFMVAIKNGVFGTSALQTADFKTTANQIAGPFSPGLVGGFYNMDLTSGNAYINKLTTDGGLTQIRLRFKLDDNNDAVANYLKLYSGNAALADRPQLVITYQLP